MKKKFDTVKMTREIRDKMSELYWKDKDEYFRQIKVAADKFKLDSSKRKKRKAHAG